MSIVISHYIACRSKGRGRSRGIDSKPMAVYFSREFRKNERFPVSTCPNLLSFSLPYFLVPLFLSFCETAKTTANERLGIRQESRGQWSDFSVSQGNMNPEKPSDRSIGERHPERWLSRSRPRNPTATWVNQSRTKESRYAVTGQHVRLRLLVAIDLAGVVVVDVGILMAVGSPSSDVTHAMIQACISHALIHRYEMFLSEL